MPSKKHRIEPAICDVCGKTFARAVYRTKRGEGQTCGRACATKRNWQRGAFSQRSDARADESLSLAHAAFCAKCGAPRSYRAGSKSTLCAACGLKAGGKASAIVNRKPSFSKKELEQLYPRRSWWTEAKTHQELGQMARHELETRLRRMPVGAPRERLD